MGARDNKTILKSLKVTEAIEIIKNFDGSMFIDGCNGKMSDNDLIEIAGCIEKLKNPLPKECERIECKECGKMFDLEEVSDENFDVSVCSDKCFYEYWWSR